MKDDISYKGFIFFTQRSQADNIVSIKKIQMNDGKEYPYCSSQAVRRALREQLASIKEGSCVHFKKDKPCEGITPCSAGAVWRRHGFWNQLYVGESRRDTEHI